MWFFSDHGDEKRGQGGGRGGRGGDWTTASEQTGGIGIYFHILLLNMFDDIVFTTPDCGLKMDRWMLVKDEVSCSIQCTFVSDQNHVWLRGDFEAFEDF